MFIRKHLKIIVLLLATALLLWWLGRKLDWNEVRVSLQQADWRWLLLAAGLVCSTYLLRAYRWRTLLAPLAPASIRELFLSTTVGFGAMFLFGRAGEAARPAVLPLRDPRVGPAAAFVTIMVERLFDLVITAIFFSLCLRWLKAPAGQEAEFQRLNRAGLLLLAGMAFGLGCLVVFQRNSAKLVGWLEARYRGWPLPERLGRLIVGTLQQLGQALRILVNVRELATVSGWTVVIWLVIILGDWCILRAFWPQFTVADAAFVMSFSLIGSLVPTPGGAAGAFHAATVAGLLLLARPGVTTESATAFALMFHLINFAPALLFAVYYLLRGDINLARLRQAASAETIEHVVEEESLTDDPLGPGELAAAPATD